MTVNRSGVVPPIPQRSVWKFDVPIDGASHAIPMGARLLHVAAQFPVDRHDVVATWWEVNPAAPKVLHSFVIVGTGHPVPEDYAYRGTALVLGGNLVWHVYEGAS